STGRTVGIEYHELGHARVRDAPHADVACIRGRAPELLGSEGDHHRLAIWIVGRAGLDVEKGSPVRARVGCRTELELVAGDVVTDVLRRVEMRHPRTRLGE